MFCKNCGAQMNDNQAICLNCGVKTGEGTAFCQNCGQSLPEGAEVCLSCGVGVKNTSYLNGKDKVTMAILCFFLGGIGVHNFVLGETKKGILKIVTAFCGISWIFALIDFVKILTDKYEVDPEKLI